MLLNRLEITSHYEMTFIGQLR